MNILDFFKKEEKKVKTDKEFIQDFIFDVAYEVKEDTKARSLSREIKVFREVQIRRLCARLTKRRLSVCDNRSRDF